MPEPVQPKEQPAAPVVKATAAAEKGVDPLPVIKEEVSQGLTKEAFRQMLEDVLAEKASEDERKEAMKAAKEALLHSSETNNLAKENREKIDQVCEGVECLKQGLQGIENTIKNFSDNLKESLQEEEQNTAPPAPIPVQEPPPAPAPKEVNYPEEHQHGHPEHLVSPEMAAGVLDRIMACNHCSPSMKAALKMRFKEYFPNYEKVREETTGDEDSDGRGIGDEQPTKPAQVGSGSEEKQAEEAKDEGKKAGEAVSGPAEPDTEPDTEPPTADEPASGQSGADPAAPVVDGTADADGGTGGFDDPLGFI
jgi:hypothetical protein